VSIIDPRFKAFAHLDRLAKWEQGDKPAPITVEWDLSNACSLKCQGCHFAHTHEKGPWAGADRPDEYASTGLFANTRIVFRGLAEMYQAGVRGIVWSGGGEPTLHPDRLAIWSYAHTLGLEQGMYTHGGHLDQELAEIVAEYFTWVVVSLDAGNAGDYGAEKGVKVERFHDACNGLRWMADKRQATIGASFLLHKDNWFKAPLMLSTAQLNHAHYTHFRPLILTDVNAPSTLMGDTGWIDEAMPLLERLAADNRDVILDVGRFRAVRDWTDHGYKICHGIKVLTQVTPDGKVWICPNRRGIAGSEIGNLTAESFADIWKRHPKAYQVNDGCRAMCRLHLTNQTMAHVFTKHDHEAFV